MKQQIDELKEVVATFTLKMSQISETEFRDKPHPEKWSKQEVLGHLIDSAHNNLRRFISSQYETQPPHIFYDQDFWVTVNQYQHMAKHDVIALWKMMNERIIDVLSVVPPEHYAFQCNTGRNEPSYKTLAWLAADYVHHLKHHLNQIIPASFDLVYIST